MGDPRRLRKKYHTPSNPFEKERIVEEMKYVGTYGLRNKKEFWKHRSQLTKFRALARSYKGLAKEQFDVRMNELRVKLSSWGLVSSTAAADEILSLTVEKFLERRLQTMVYKKGLAKTVYQARQLVTHSHIAVQGAIVDSPSYLVTTDDEKAITYAINSPFYKDKSKLFASGTVEEPVKEKTESKEENEE